MKRPRDPNQHAASTVALATRQAEDPLRKKTKRLKAILKQADEQKRLRT